jgi:Septum formation initiator
MSLETWTSATTVRADYSPKSWKNSRVRRDANRSLAQNLAFSLYAALALYCVLSFCFGQGGLIAYGKLQARRTAMEENLSLLEQRRSSLNAELESLKSDPDRAAREARGLGYLRKDETQVILSERVERVESLDSGSVLPYAQSGGIADLALKEISFGVFLAALAFLCAPAKKLSRSRQLNRSRSSH